jgi:DNA-binding IclR family transcriptional regulator
VALNGAPATVAVKPAPSMPPRRGRGIRRAGASERPAAARSRARPPGGDVATLSEPVAAVTVAAPADRFYGEDELVEALLRATAQIGAALGAPEAE